MRIAALSDFHIGAHRHADGFRHDVDSFARTLDRLEAEHDRVVLLGDIFQTDHTAWPHPLGSARSLDLARRRVPSLAERFDRATYQYVHGNHDAVAGPARGAPERWLAPGRFGALFIHGHQFDPIAVEATWAAHLGTWTTGRLRALGLRPLARWFEGHDVAIKHERFKGPEGPYARGAAALMEEHGVPIVVMGHTHVHCITPVGRGVMVNTGTCSDRRTTWVSVDTERGVVEVHGPDGVRRHDLGDAAGLPADDAGGR